MSVDTRANIRGYVNHEDIINYIRENWDENVTTNIRREVVMPLTKCDWSYKINEHSDDPENWYGICGIIYFTYKGENECLPITTIILTRLVIWRAIQSLD